MIERKGAKTQRRKEEKKESEIPISVAFPDGYDIINVFQHR